MLNKRISCKLRWAIAFSFFELNTTITRMTTFRPIGPFTPFTINHFCIWWITHFYTFTSKAPLVVMYFWLIFQLYLFLFNYIFIHNLRFDYKVYLRPLLCLQNSFVHFQIYTIISGTCFPFRCIFFKLVTITDIVY